MIPTTRKRIYSGITNRTAFRISTAAAPTPANEGMHIQQCKNRYGNKNRYGSKNRNMKGYGNIDYIIRGTLRHRSNANICCSCSEFSESLLGTDAYIRKRLLSSDSGKGGNSKATGPDDDDTHSNTNTNANASAKDQGTPINWPGLLLAMGIGSGVVGYYLREKERRREEVMSKQNKVVGKALLGGPWTLVDHNGNAVTDATYTQAAGADADADVNTDSDKNSSAGGESGNKSKFMLLYFGFTHCPDICPAELQKMSKIIDKLDNIQGVGKVVTPVFISVDPQRDGVAQVRNYVKDFHPRMVGLTGTPQQIADVCKAFRVYHNVADLNENDEDDYLVDHSIVMYLVGPDGSFLDFYTQMTETDEAVERIAKYVRGTGV